MKSRTTQLRLYTLGACLALIAGCQTAPTRDPAFAPVRPPERPTPAQRNGAIFQAQSHAAPVLDVALFSDQKAHQVGDILTIKLVEATAASKTAETNIDQSTDFSNTSPTVLGNTPRFGLPRSDGGRFTLDNAFASDKSFAGSGDSSQSNSLSGAITVSVAEVLPNGNLMVQGEKILTLNRGHEQVRFSGIVRSADVGPDNTVPSTKVANATIVYSGEGEVANSNVLGWLGRFFLSVLMPF